MKIQEKKKKMMTFESKNKNSLLLNYKKKYNMNAIEHQQNSRSEFEDKLSKHLHNKLAEELGTDKVTIFVNHKYGKSLKYLGVEYQRCFLEGKEWKEELGDYWDFLDKDNTLTTDNAVTWANVASCVKDGLNAVKGKVFHLQDYFNKTTLTKRQKAEKAILEAYNIDKYDCLPIPLLSDKQLKGVAYLVFPSVIKVTEDVKQQLINSCNELYNTLNNEYAF